MGVARVASGWKLWVWLECIGVVSGCCYKEVQYINILIIIIAFPYSTCVSSFFGSSIPISLFIFKMFFLSLSTLSPCTFDGFANLFFCIISSLSLNFSLECLPLSNCYFSINESFRCLSNSLKLHKSKLTIYKNQPKFVLLFSGILRLGSSFGTDAG